MDISFNCDKCGQRLAIDEAGAGQIVDCPKCKTPLEVPYKSQSVVAVSDMLNVPPSSGRLIMEFWSAAFIVFLLLAGAAGLLWFILAMAFKAYTLLNK